MSHSPAFLSDTQTNRSTTTNTIRSVIQVTLGIRITQLEIIACSCLGLMLVICVSLNPSYLKDMVGVQNVMQKLSTC